MNAITILGEEMANVIKGGVTNDVVAEYVSRWLNEGHIDLVTQLNQSIMETGDVKTEFSVALAAYWAGLIIMHSTKPCMN